MKAAVCYAYDQPLVIEEIDIRIKRRSKVRKTYRIAAQKSASISKLTVVQTYRYFGRRASQFKKNERKNIE